MNIVVGVAAAVAAGSGVGVGLADPRTRHRKKASKSTEKTQKAESRNRLLDGTRGGAQTHLDWIEKDR